MLNGWWRLESKKVINVYGDRSRRAVDVVVRLDVCEKESGEKRGRELSKSQRGQDPNLLLPGTGLTVVLAPLHSDIRPRATHLV